MSAGTGADPKLAAVSMAMVLTALASGAIGGAIGAWVGSQKSAEAATAYLVKTDPCSVDALKAREQLQQISFAMEANRRTLDLQKIIIDSCVKQGRSPSLDGGKVTCTPIVPGPK